MDRQAIECRRQDRVLERELRAAQDGSKAPMAEGPVQWHFSDPARCSS
jgi:hypothetical protein